MTDYLINAYNEKEERTNRERHVAELRAKAAIEKDPAKRDRLLHEALITENYADEGGYTQYPKDTQS